MILDLFERRSSPENPRTNLSDPDSWLWDAFGATKNAAGVSVNARTAMQMSAVFACVRVLAESMASLPAFVYERLERGKQIVREHPLHRLVHDEPNPEMSAFAFKETLQAHVATYGNAFAEIEFNGRGEPIGLWPLMPDVTRVERISGRKLVRTSTPDGTVFYLNPEKVLHIPGLGYDGLNGYSVVRMASQSIGLGMATEEYGARFFGQGAKPAGVLQAPAGVGPEAQGQIMKAWEKMQGGLSNSHRIAILTHGMTFQPITIPNEDAQFLETRKFQVTDIARWFRIPPHMIGDLERSTNNNIEHQGLEFVKYTLRPWVDRWEQAINRTLVLPSQRKRFFVEFNMEAMLRGDSAARSQFYREMFNIGVYSQNDIRAKENENPIPDGDRYFVPLNMVPADKVDEQLSKPEPEPAPAPKMDEEMDDDMEEMNSHVAGELRRVLALAMEQAFRRRAKAIRNQLGKGDLQAFRAWFDGFVAKERELAQLVARNGPDECDAYATTVRTMLMRPESAQDQISKFVDDYHARAEHWAAKELEHITQRKAA